MPLLNPVSLAANAISYGMTGKGLLEHVADGIFKATGSDMTYSQALKDAKRAIKQAGSSNVPQSNTPQPEVGATAGSTRPDKDDLKRPTKSPMRYNDEVVSRTEMRPPAMR